MSSTTSPTQVDLDWADEPDISRDHLRYIKALNESPVCYTRFFDALLIQKPAHNQFLHDLKAFREQPTALGLLQQGTKDAYRKCTSAFVASPFAHPWCRTASDFQSGWTRASWRGTTKKVSAEAQKEEDRLHRLLVPLWIAFRRRMFPEPEVLAEWLAGEEQRQKDREAEAHHDAGSSANPRSSFESSSADYPELGSKTMTANTPASSKPASKTSDSGAGAAATQLFLGVAVTGFLMSDKRVRKYVEKKLNKK